MKIAILGLNAAVEEARRRWPDFVQAFERRTLNQDFGVKALFRDGEHGEWMWIAVSSINGEVVQGKLGNEPVDVRSVREGDSVTVQAKEIGDWFYNEGEKLVGGFSLARPDKP